MMAGSHLLKSYSRQQKVLALSSAEAETYGMVACSAELLGIQACARDMGLNFTVNVYADASAALGIVHRRGLGNIRHISTQCLWLQEAHATKRIAYEKVDGSRNPADMMTKGLGKADIDRYLDKLQMYQRDGRSAAAPQLKSQG